MSGQLVGIEAIMGQVARAKTSEGGNHIRAGTYLLEVRKTIYKKGRTSQYGIGELIVKESTATGRDLDGKDVAPNKPGEYVSTVFDLATDMGPPNFKAMLLGILGEEDRPGDEEWAAKFQQDALAIVDEKTQPGRGVLVKCVAATIAKRNGDPFTKLSWFPVVENNDAEQIKARRAAQGKEAA